MLAPRAATARVRPRPVEVVVVGLSTGGPAALSIVAKHLPWDLGAPMLVAQHMLEGFIARFAASLQESSHLYAREATDGMDLVPGCIYLAAGGKHLVAARDGARLVARYDDGPHEHGCKPAADPLFRSAAKTCGAGVLAVVMTGLGSDGVAGCREVIAAGGEVFVQDPATAVAPNMPGAVVGAGLASRVLSPDDLGRAIAQRVAAR